MFFRAFLHHTEFMYIYKEKRMFISAFVDWIVWRGGLGNILLIIRADTVVPLRV